MNIIGVSPLGPPAIQTITSEIYGVLDKFYNQENKIEIEFKYAKFKRFCNSMYGDDVNRMKMNEQTKKQVYEVMNYYVLQQNKYHFETIKKLSFSSMIILNVLGKIYSLDSEFDEEQHKKFYKIREALIRICQENKCPHLNNLNFYNNLISEKQENKSFEILNRSEIRIDVIIMNGEDSGRYSYLVGEGWTKIKKQNLIQQQQYDLIMSEKIFRLAIKKQEEVSITFPEVLQIFSKLQSTNHIMMRCKRALRVEKNRQLQFSLSEIYHPQRNTESLQQHFEDLKDNLYLESENLDEFSKRIFQKFYHPETVMKKQAKFQIQCEFTQKGVSKLNAFKNQRNHRGLELFIRSAIDELYGLFFLDHNIKRREMPVLQEMKENFSNEDAKGRLQNEFGSYMHDLIYEKMTE